MSGRCGAAEMWSGIVMLKHSTVEFHVRNDMMLQDLVSVSDTRQYTYHMYNIRPTTMIPAHTMTLLIPNWWSEM